MVSYLACISGLGFDKDVIQDTVTQLKGDPSVKLPKVSIEIVSSYLKSSVTTDKTKANGNAPKILDQCALKSNVAPPAVSKGEPVTEYGNKNPALPERIPDGWVNFLFKSEAGRDCPPASRDNSGLDKKNILADIHPTLYGDDGKGSTFTESKGNAGFYEIQTADSCLPGGNHGGFKYEFLNPLAQTPQGKTFTLSFCAESIDADGLALAVQHEDGQGQVTCFSRSAMITTKRQRFSWDCTLDGHVYGPGVINSPQRYIFFYLVDFTNQRGCVKDDTAKDKMFAKKKFVIGDIRLEMHPEPTVPK